MNTLFEPYLVEGGHYTDERGVVRFVNDFDMLRLTRMYSIESNPDVIRAWQGHQFETIWFFVAKGIFLVKTIEIGTNIKKVFRLSCNGSAVLCIPGGHFNGLVALEEHSVMMVFSDVDLSISKNDDLRQSVDLIPW